MPSDRALEERFFSKVRETPDGCWEWTAAVVNKGYGKFNLRKGKQAYAHRWCYEFMVGPIPDGLQIDHLCRNTVCVNPSHLDPVTNRVNTLRGAKVSDKCLRGHLFTEENTYIRPNGRRTCRACAKSRNDYYRSRSL
jgi:hypothetical protein